MLAAPGGEVGFRERHVERLKGHAAFLQLARTIAGQEDNESHCSREESLGSNYSSSQGSSLSHSTSRRSRREGADDDKASNQQRRKIQKRKQERLERAKALIAMDVSGIDKVSPDWFTTLEKTTNKSLLPEAPDQATPPGKRDPTPNSKDTRLSL